MKAWGEATQIHRLINVNHNFPMATDAVFPLWKCLDVLLVT